MQAKIYFRLGGSEEEKITAAICVSTQYSSTTEKEAIRWPNIRKSTWY